MDTLTNIRPFTKSWWEHFMNKNCDFSETCVIKNAINTNLVATLQEGVLQVLRERYRFQHISKGFRVYLDGIEQTHKQYLNLCTNPPLEGESIVKYTERTFDKKFGMIINNGEKHSQLLAENVIGAIQPLLDLKGLPTSGLEITIFIGNYGWTPLGIHQDHRGENVIHFHLGPGTKTMYTWDENKYDELTGGKFNNMDIEPLLEHSNEYPFEMGDIYYMPWNKYHVGFSGELSVGVTLWFNNPTEKRFMRKILNAIALQCFDNKSELSEVMAAEKNYLNNQDSLKSLVNSMNLTDEILNGSTRDFFKFIYRDFKYSIASNGGWQTLPLTMQQKERYDINDFEFLTDKKIYAKENFPIHYYLDNGILYLFVRGKKIQMRYHHELVNIVDKLNTNQYYVVLELLTELNKEWPLEAGLYFLSELYNSRGIYIVE